MDELKELNRRLAALLNDPQPGLASWRGMLSDVLLDMALFCGRGNVIAAVNQCKFEDSIR